MTVLGYLFLAIFALTAILTLASLPGWINIPEWYRKKLFIALVLEVVGAVIMLFNQTYTTPGKPVPVTQTVYVSKDFDAERTLFAIKRNEDTWYVKKDSVSLGYISIRVDQEQMIADSLKNIYKVDKEYEVGNMRFFFRIDSIGAYGSKEKLYTYYIRFGERSGSQIIWQDTPAEFYKTRNGALDLGIGLKAITHQAWKYSYYVSMGVGQPTLDKEVPYLNLVMLRIKIE